MIPPIDRDRSVGHDRGRHEAAGGEFIAERRIENEPAGRVRAGLELIVDHRVAEAVISAALVTETVPVTVDADAVGAANIEYRLMDLVEIRSRFDGHHTRRNPPRRFKDF